MATVLWALLLAALTWLSVRQDPPTVREQRTLAQARPVVDRTVGELVAAAGPDALVELVPPAERRGCRVTPFEDGGSLERAVHVRLAGEKPRTVLDRIAEALPDDYRATVLLTRDGEQLRADAGEFVSVRGAEAGDDVVRLTVTTGCRPLGSTTDPAPVSGADAETDAAHAALRALGRTPDGQPELVGAPCPGGGTARTAWATGSPTGSTTPTSPAAALAPLASGPAVVDIPGWYAYRVGPVGVQVDLTADPPSVSASTGCR